MKLFCIRLKEISKVNALPALIIGLGLDVLLLLSGGGSWAELLVIPVTILSMNLFFSMHYLTLYYLLQPFNAGTEIKSGTYQVFTGVTYFVCYMLMKTELPPMLFGLLCIAFCLIYSIVACAMVYRFAPRPSAFVSKKTYFLAQNRGAYDGHLFPWSILYLLWNCGDFRTLQYSTEI